MSKGPKKSAPKSSSSTDKAERRKHPRKKTSTLRAVAKPEESCTACAKDLKGEERALYVEEEIGRIFCSEECIATHFSPEIERLEKEYFKHLSDKDLNGTDREKFAHLRWITLEEPDECWRQKTLSGDYRYTLISEFSPGNKPIWCVCICLFLRGEPSFLYLAFPTKNAAMVNHYRRGERVEWEKKPKGARRSQDSGMPSSPSEAIDAFQAEDAPPTDGLADAWTETETLRAEMNMNRQDGDVPAEDYAQYQACLEETLESPDELWTLKSDGDEPKTYHFIRYYPEEEPGIWYVIVARETEDAEQLEILDSFPTRDSQMVDRFRIGDQEVGAKDAQPQSRLVH